MSQSVNEYLTLSQRISTAVIPQWIKTVDKTLKVLSCLKYSLLCVGKYQMGFEVLFLSLVLQKFKCRLLTFATFVILKTGRVNWSVSTQIDFSSECLMQSPVIYKYLIGKVILLKDGLLRPPPRVKSEWGRQMNEIISSDYVS